MTSQHPRRSRRRDIVLAACVLAGALVAAACSSSAPSTNSSTGSSPSSEQGLKFAEAAVAKDYAGTDRALPTSTPAVPKRKNIWVIACTTLAEGCDDPALGVKAAAEHLGWKVTVFNGQLTPADYTDGIDDAIADHASAVVLISVDCEYIKTALAQARAHGVKVYGVLSLDCNETGAGPPLFTGSLAMDAPGLSYSQTLKVEGTAAADWIIAKTHGQARVLELRGNFDDGLKLYGEAAEAELHAHCPDCVSVVDPFPAASGPDGTLDQLVESALLAHPQTNVVLAPADAVITLGAGEAVKEREGQTGKTILLTGLDGLAPNMAQIRAGGPDDYAVGIPDSWLGWAAVDELIRLFDGQPQVFEGIGFQAVDKSHNLPATTAGYNGNVNSSGQPKQDYVAEYLRLWKVSS